MAMIGGGQGAFIGPVHRMAAALDGEVVLVAGCFSSDGARNRETGRQLGLAEDRVYESATALLAGEAARLSSERAEFVSIVTPNHLHAHAAIAALEHDFAVLCEKPLARTLAEAEAVQAAADEAGRQVGITYTYLGYPLVEEARALVAAGQIGAVRRVAASYTQGWLSLPVEEAGNAQAAWRTDPASAGIGGAMGDIGVHAQSLLEHISGLRIASVSADIRAGVPGRRLDDDGAVLLRLENGARGTLTASQICAGDENCLQISVFGETGSLRWSQENPNELWLRQADRPEQRITANGALISNPAAAMLRVPAGHPEGYIEAFANLYRRFARQVRGYDKVLRLPDAGCGVRSLAFLEAVISSSSADGKWQALAENIVETGTTK